jgi:hypothetical protein
MGWKAGVRFLAEEELFSSPQRPDRLWGDAQRLMKWVNGAASPEIKRKGREADHSPLSSAEIENGGRIPSLPHTSSWRGD